MSVRIGAVLPLFSLAVQRLVFSHLYTTMGLLGIFIAGRGIGIPIIHVLPVFAITITTTGIYLLNDVFDLEIDKIIHPERAMPRGTVNVRHASIVAVLLLTGGPLVAFSFNTVSGVLVAMIALVGVAYSVPPLRLRRFPVVPNGMIGLMVFLSFLAGTSFWHGPITGKLVFGGLLLWALVLLKSMEKDLGEEEGDAVGGVKTLPVILGGERAIKITAAMGLSSFIFPILFVLLFDLHWILVVAIVLFFIPEAYIFRGFCGTPGTATSKPSHVRLFMIFVAIQISLLVGALL